MRNFPGSSEEKEKRYNTFKAKCVARDTQAGEEGLLLRNELQFPQEKELINRINIDLANYYTEVESRITHSNSFLADVMAQLNEHTDFVMLAGHKITLGRNHHLLGQLVDCRNAYMDAVLLMEGKQLTEKGEQLLAMAYQNLAAVHNELRLDHIGDEYLEKSFAAYRKLENKRGLMNALNARAHRHEMKGHGEDALADYREALRLGEEAGQREAVAIFKTNIGSYLCRSKRNVEEGIQLLQEAYDEAKRYSNVRIQSELCYMLAYGISIGGSPDAAEPLFEEAQQLFLASGAQFHHSDFFKHWAENLAAQNRFEEALRKYELHQQHQDTLRAFNNTVALTETQLRIQLADEKRTTETLQRKHAEIEDYAHQLEISNDELRQFTYVASHDLKEPLRQMTNYTQLLEKSLGDASSAEQREFMAYLKQGGTRMLHVLNDLLLHARISRSPQLQLVDLNETAQRAYESLQLEWSNRQVMFTFQPLPVISGDREHLFQLFRHLIANAVQHNHQELPLVEIRYRLHEQQHLLEVHDNGPGISPAYRQQVFTIFQRLHNRSTHDGNGIGLAICKKVVDYLRGKIWIEESPLGGCAVHILLPQNGH